MESPIVAKNVALDMMDAKGLKVQKTPEYYVSGKTMSAFGYDQLKQLVATEMASAYR